MKAIGIEMTDLNIDQWLQDYKRLRTVSNREPQYAPRNVKDPEYLEELLERADDE